MQAALHRLYLVKLTHLLSDKAVKIDLGIFLKEFHQTLNIHRIVYFVFPLQETLQLRILLQNDPVQIALQLWITQLLVHYYECLLEEPRKQLE